MKSFRQILGEVAQPKPEEERAFKDMHSYETMPHPVALDHQFTGEIAGAGDATRIADQKGDAKYDTSYDDAFEYAGPSFDEQANQAIMNRLAESNLDEASASVYKDMPKAPGKMVSNRVQVKAFKDSNAMGAFLSKQNDNSWQQTGVPGLKSGKYKIDMVKKGGKPSKNFIRVNEEVELDMDYREQADQAIINRLEEKAVERKDYNPYAKSTKRAVQHANAQKEIAKARNDAVKVGREVPTRRELENQRDKK